MKNYILGGLLCLSSSLVLAGTGEVYTVGPISAGDCDYTNIQDAINEEREILHIVEAVYSENVIISNLDVSMIGGFSSCQTAEDSVFNPGAYSTIDPSTDWAMLISGESDADSYNVTLIGIELINGEAEGFVPSGGLTVVGEVDLAMYQSRIADNTSILGGGVYVQSPASLFMRDTMVNGNTAFDGGGIYCYGCQLTVDRGSGIYNNQAVGKGLTYDGSGGGLYARDEGQVFIFSGSKNPESEQLGIHQNEAFFQGGGIYSNNSLLSIYGNEFFGFGDDSNPVNITHNSAYEGGGIYAEESEVNATAFDVSINQAAMHGAGMAIKFGSSLNVYADNLFADETCWNNNPQQCNRMLNNQINNSDLTPKYGGAIRSTASDISISNVWFQGNSAGGSGGGSVFFGESGNLYFQNSVMFQNGDESGTDQNVIDVRDSNFNFTQGSVVDNTVASSLIDVIDNLGETIIVTNSIFHNSDQTPVINLTGDDDAFLSFNCMIVHEIDSFAGLGSVINVTEGDPVFFNRSAGDLNLYSDSILGVDRCQAEGSPIPAYDLRLFPRGIDVNGLGNDDNPFIHDIGAIEYQGSDELLDVIFKTSFEPIF